MFKTRARPGATPAIVERALDFSKEVIDLTHLRHPSSVSVHRPQITVAMALFMQALEHRQAIILLLVHGARSSAAALVRPTFEACFRGVWALTVANGPMLHGTALVSRIVRWNADGSEHRLQGVAESLNEGSTIPCRHDYGQQTPLADSEHHLDSAYADQIGVPVAQDGTRRSWI